MYPAQLESDPPLIADVDGTLLKTDLPSRERKARRVSFALVAATAAVAV